MTATSDEVAAVAREVLESSNLNEITEKQLRQLVKERTGADTSLPDLKALIHSVVEEFLNHEGQAEEEAQGEGGDVHARAAQGSKAKRRRSGNDSDGEEDDAEETSVNRPIKKSSKQQGGSGSKKFEVGESGELIVCKLSGKRRVTVTDFKGKLFVNIREFFEKDGQERPGKGISLPLDQWETLSQHVDDVELAIKQMKH